MVEIRQTAVFRAWLAGLRDLRARGRIAVRIDRLAEGNPGDVKSVGDGVSELRIDHGPGYRLYFTRQGALLVILLCGGDKSSQDRDIRQAKALAKEANDAS
ncbi:MAG TPA: type II toxin-antitoxin system RelE/ParE family toxin [Caulobacteraceae bacterium]|jgi:putative addiction module killer protein|nr:type II toxin-antitoxin system RelE/ParE family toxin [Caulobacteraceae bacterium]